MNHSYNRNAFKLAFSLSGNGNILLSIYSKLVCIELALKDDYKNKFETWSTAKHNISELLNYIDLNSDGIKFNNALKKIKHTDLNGKSLISIKETNYPALRYLNHQSDFQNGSTNLELEELNVIINDIILQMKNKGVMI